MPFCFRDKSIIVWNLTHEEGTYGHAKRALKGHSHFVQDVVISSDGQFALSGVQINDRQHSKETRQADVEMCSYVIPLLHRFMGRHTASVGPELRKHNQAIHWTHQGCPQRCFLCGQQTGVTSTTIIPISKQTDMQSILATQLTLQRAA